ncbi:MAG: Ig-like domain-containing protein [Gammaproteobacteria bacterium]
MEATRCVSRFIFSLFLLAPNLAMAANHYVRAGATGDGSDWAYAYNDLPSSLVRGDVYYIADGSYKGHRFADSDPQLQLITIKKATSTDHGTDTGWSTAYGDGQAVFNGQLEFIGDNYLIDGQTGGGPGSWKSGFGFVLNAGGGKGIRGTSGSNIAIRHIEIYGHGDDLGECCANDLLYLLGGSNYTLSHAYLHDAGRTLYLIRISNVFTEYVYGGKFESTPEQHSEIASVVGDHITFANSIYDHVEGTGGLIVEGDDLQVYGCVFNQTNDSWGGANGVIGTWTASTLTNARIYNNTFLDAQRLFGFYNTPSTGNRIHNNIFYSSAKADFGGVESHDYNHYVNMVDDRVPVEKNRTVVRDSGNPFVNVGEDDFRLIRATRAAPTLFPPYNKDPLGAPRGADGTWERGAYEFIGPDGPDTTPPAVAITSPANGATVSGVKTISAKVLDGTGVTSVQFKLDGNDLGSVDRSSPFAISWDTSQTANGSHTLNAVATDRAGNVAASSAVTITVDDTSPPPPPLLPPSSPTGLTIESRS